jgi:hypothetical protein
VFAGVLGRLQPRFHIFGDAVRTAESMEQSGQVDAVHASHCFISSLSRAAPRSSPLAALVPQTSVLCQLSPEPALNQSDAGQNTQCNSLKEPETSHWDCTNISGLEHQRDLSEEIPLFPSNGHYDGPVFTSMGWRLGPKDTSTASLVKGGGSFLENHDCQKSWTMYPNRMSGEDDTEFESPTSETMTQLSQHATKNSPNQLAIAMDDVPFARKHAADDK